MHRTRIAPPQASVFMTHEGHVVLNWVDAADQVSDLEFGEKKITYFSELTGDERVFELNEAPKLKKLLLLPELESNLLPITQFS